MRTMNSKERQDSLDAMKRQHEKMKGDPAAARAFLIDLGVLEPDGTLSRKYHSAEEVRKHKIKKLTENTED